MLDSIVQKAQLADYDFRQTANPDDPLKYLFSEWVNYYKLKWAIARILQPASILEIGVRFGYSAAAFLHGYSGAKLVGIDLDTDFYGGVKGAINWAKEITGQFDAQFMISDTQAMNCFPGEIYDLIHVDGQQDGDSSFHDLELAIKQAHYVLVDGYLWTKQNFNAVSEFLFRYADLLEWYGVIPGYAGDLLIKIARDRIGAVGDPVTSSLGIRNTYTSNYYTQDCGGFDEYKKNRGKSLEDPRLQAVATLASLKKQGRVLDIACGRGELTYYFAKQKFAVTAIDYSQNAIELAQKCFDGEENLKTHVEFLCDDICNVSLLEKYDLAVASDVIEHLSFEEVELLYNKVSQALKTDGLLVVHTFPNLWYYQYEYPKKRKIAASVGAYLPAQPRTRYEMLMHINEQSPRVLNKQLARHFEHVLVWFAEPINPGGSLIKKYSKQEMRSATSLFAIASHQPINLERVKERVQMYPLPSLKAGTIELAVTKHPNTVLKNSEFEVFIELTNHTNFAINSYTPNPVHISYHWIDEKATRSIIFDGKRSKILPILNSLTKNSYQAKIKAPQNIGNYILRMTLVQEGVRWFEENPTNLGKDIQIVVK